MDRVEHFMTFEKLIFRINSKMWRIPTGIIQSKYSQSSKLQIDFIFSVETLDIFQIIAKMSFSKIAECSTLIMDNKTMYTNHAGTWKDR